MSAASSVPWLLRWQKRIPTRTSGKCRIPACRLAAFAVAPKRILGSAFGQRRWERLPWRWRASFPTRYRHSIWSDFCRASRLFYMIDPRDLSGAGAIRTDSSGEQNARHALLPARFDELGWKCRAPLQTGTRA